MRWGGTRTLRSSALWVDFEGRSGAKREAEGGSISMFVSSVVGWGPSVTVVIMASSSAVGCGASWRVSSTASGSSALWRAVGAGILSVWRLYTGVR